jgi:hypothetical protein
VEEPAFLVAVQRVVGGVEVERDLRWRLLVRVEEQVDEQRLNRIQVGGKPGVTRRLRAAQLQPVECAFARQRRAIGASGREFARQHSQYRIVA